MGLLQNVDYEISCPNDSQSQWPQKRKATEEKEDIIRNAKVKGIEDDCKCSRFYFFEKIPEVKRRQIMENFNDMASKNEQDSHLSGLISLHMIVRSHTWVSNHENSKDHLASYTYKVCLDGKDVPVCHKAFIIVNCGTTPFEYTTLVMMVPGQNKNRTMMHFIYCLVHVLKLYDKVTYIFPVRGHTYRPNDKDFSLIGHKKKITTSAELPVDWDGVICSARKYPTPFFLCIMGYDGIQHDMKAATYPFFLKTPKPPLQLKEA
ncbi:hypothetical protein PR048_005320 [Dryococelus australis]|uniref:DUF7869 domain-containing protein n=1 Tax=Dryococelus australis TaxID=614101 RepID=A0ABQ9I7Y2_9NEOP|nr:hypothetical protein PR048_005320 [Dryococelus australis]